MRYLSSLKGTIDKELLALGFLRDPRKYSPHITIARDIIPDEDMEKLHEIFLMNDFNEIHVNSFHLMLSEHIDGKRLYTSLKTFNLK